MSITTTTTKEAMTQLLIKEIPRGKELCKQLGFRLGSTRPPGKFLESTHSWRRQYHTPEGVPGQDPIDWRSSEVQRDLEQLAIDYLDSGLYGVQFWPAKGLPSPRIVPEYPKDKDKIVALLCQLFWRQNTNALYDKRHHPKSKHNTQSRKSSHIEVAEKNSPVSAIDDEKYKDQSKKDDIPRTYDTWSQPNIERKKRHISVSSFSSNDEAIQIIASKSSTSFEKNMKNDKPQIISDELRQKSPENQRDVKKKGEKDKEKEQSKNETSGPPITIKQRFKKEFPTHKSPENLGLGNSELKRRLRNFEKQTQINEREDYLDLAPIQPESKADHTINEFVDIGNRKPDSDNPNIQCRKRSAADVVGMPIKRSKLAADKFLPGSTDSIQTHNDRYLSSPTQGGGEGESRVFIRFVIIKTRYPRLSKRDWNIRSLTGKTITNIFEDISKIVLRKFQDLTFRLSTSNSDLEVVITKGDEDCFTQLQKNFAKEIKLDMKSTRNRDFVIEIEPEADKTTTTMIDDDDSDERDLGDYI